MSDGMTEAYRNMKVPKCAHSLKVLDGAKVVCGDCNAILDNELIHKKPVEADPNGKSAHEPGAKLDAGKLRADLVLGDFSRALTAVASVGTYGANKYTDRGWQEVPNGTDRYADAGFRHYLRFKCGEELDPESGLHHLAHRAWNVLAELELRLREKESDK